MNERPLLGSGKSGLNVHLWVPLACGPDVFLPEVRTWTGSCRSVAEIFRCYFCKAATTARRLAEGRRWLG